MLCGPAACGCCGRDLTGEPVLGTPQKRQVFEASPPPPPDAWCGAHGLRDLAGLYRFDPDGQVWARSMADLLLDANAQAAAARAAGHDSLDDAQLARIRSWYRGAVAKGLTDNTGKTSQIAKDGLTLARRFRASEDMILRFAVDLAVGFTSNQISCARCAGAAVGLR